MSPIFSLLLLFKTGYFTFCILIYNFQNVHYMLVTLCFSKGVAVLQGTTRTDCIVSMGSGGYMQKYHRVSSAMESKPVRKGIKKDFSCHVHLKIFHLCVN